VSNLLLAPTLTPSEVTEIRVKEQLLQIHIAKDTVLLPITPIEEIMTVSAEQILPIPHVASWVMGIFNYRGASLWLVDLAALIGFTPLYQQVLPNTTYTLLVLKISSSEQSLEEENSPIGLMVNGVGNLAKSDRSEWQHSPSTTVTKLSPFLQGYWLKSAQEIAPVLKPEAILELSSKF
jgi:positive phototaxis protein PixI